MHLTNYPNQTESQHDRPTPTIELVEVSRVFRAGNITTRALDRITLTIQPAEWIAITGPSGSGKSTLLASLGLLEPPTTGTRRFNAIDTRFLTNRQLARLRRDYLAYIFQSIHLAPALTVADNIAIPLRGRRLSPSQRQHLVNESLDFVELAGRRDHYPAELSGGQQQRVAIARAIVSKPDIILADEPTGNLDSASGRRMLELLQKLNERGTTIVLVTHEPAVANAAHRVIELLDGRITRERHATTPSTITPNEGPPP